ncbi:SURF1 family cytochrome oxidase biogenesis protein [Leifsonia sp. Root112D2]|uniref:SURF1 family cytochrome oxidase biogenesis protein n=1 Tax=Leifsonia sp. Root112D2 TaxID=1736426 RepID=UPI0006F5F0A3|nr:SURF1 family cytochrome oxidase biogenesis protein [Leifsonia sp. Root112D2]KQV08116.1 sortase [Leifsonia sp. Root112D2]
MNRWRFAFSRRWLGYLAFAIIFAIACGFLSNWQLARSKEAAAANALLDANFNAPAVALTNALDSLTAYAPSQKWKRVTATGTYQSADELLVRNRPTDAGPGFEVLTPLKLSDGSFFIIDRGWVPTGSKQDAPDRVPPAPSGIVSVTARLKASEPRLPGRSASGNQVATIELGDVQRRIGGPVYTGAYGILESQTPAGAGGLTAIVTTPPMQDEGLHWSYMIQWIIFALIGFFGLGYAIRTEYRNRYQDEPDMQAKEAARQRRASRKAPTDADIEDELLESGSRR